MRYISIIIMITVFSPYTPDKFFFAPYNNNEYLTQMRATMETYSQMMSQCGGSFPPPGPRDPPTGGGDACAT